MTGPQSRRLLLSRMGIAYVVFCAVMILAASAASAGPISAGNLLFPNEGLNALLEFNPTTRTVVQSLALPTPYTFAGPSLELTALVRATDHHIFVNARDGAGNPVVLVLTSEGQFVASQQTGGQWLQQIAFDPLDATQSTVIGGVPTLSEVRAINPLNGLVTTRITRPAANFISLVTDIQGNIYVGDFDGGNVLVYSSSGTFQAVFADLVASTGSNEPNGMTIDAAGSVYVAQNTSNRIAKFSSAGAFMGFLTNSSFNRAISPFFNPGDGLLYVGSYNDGRLVILTSSGIEVAVVDLGGRFLGVPAPVPGAAGPSEQFQFDGFAEPVTMGVTNMATAGRAIPLKWRLTDLMNNPVDDSSSFVGVFSYQIACDGSAVTDAVEEYASGTSGLQYIGDGNWQFNWSTQRQYSRTCRRMYLKLSDGQTSDQVKFQFK